MELRNNNFHWCNFMIFSVSTLYNSISNEESFGGRYTIYYFVHRFSQIFRIRMKYSHIHSTWYFQIEGLHFITSDNFNHIGLDYSRDFFYLR